MYKRTLPTIVIFGYLALIAANLIWAAAGPIIKLTTQQIPPFTFLFLRFLLVCILILPYTVVELSKHKVAISDYWKIFVLGIFSQASIILIVLGLQYASAVDMALIGSLSVILTIWAGHYFFKETVHFGLTVGLIIALFGTLIVIFEPLLSRGMYPSSIPAGYRVWGNILIFLYHIAFLLYIIWSKISFGQSTSVLKKSLHFLHIKPMQSQYPSSLLSAVSFYVGMVAMLPFAVLENFGYFGQVTYDLMALDAKAVLGIVYMAVFSSIVAYFLFEWALSIISVSDTAIIGYVSAIFGVPFAFLILGELPTYYAVVGAVVIGIGVVIAEVSLHFHRRKQGILKRLGVHHGPR